MRSVNFGNLQILLLAAFSFYCRSLSELLLHIPTSMSILTLLALRGQLVSGFTSGLPSTPLLTRARLFHYSKTIKLCADSSHSVAASTTATTTATTINSTSFVQHVDEDDVNYYSHMLQFDGGSRGNPGLGGSSAVIYQRRPRQDKREEDTENGMGDHEFEEVWHGYKWHGSQLVTCNVAEYCGVIEGLQYLKSSETDIESLLVQGDSQLVIKQLAGEYKVRHSGLRLLHSKAMLLLKQMNIPKVTFAHIPRALNKRADYLANKAMDSKKSHNSDDSIYEQN